LHSKTVFRDALPPDHTHWYTHVSSPVGDKGIFLSPPLFPVHTRLVFTEMCLLCGVGVTGAELELLIPPGPGTDTERLI
jgi:hypothetical protein